MMERSLLLRMAAIGLLAGVVVAETLPARRAAAPPRPAPLPAHAPGSPATVSPAAPQVQAYVSTALARPLFRADRRPPVIAEAPQAAAPGEGGLPRLSGIVVSAGGATAIFEGGSKPLVARVGDRLGAFTVATIAAGRVTLDGPQGPQVVTPSFDKTLTHTAPAFPAAPSPPRLLDGAAASMPLPPAPTLRGLLDQRRAMEAVQPQQQ